MAVMHNAVLWKYISSENCCQWLKLHVINDWKSIYYFACGLEVPLRTIEWSLAHMWEIRTLWLLEGNLYGQNRVGFHPWINFFWKAKAYGSKYINTKSDIYSPHNSPYRFLQEILLNLFISKEKQQRSFRKYRKYYIKIFEDL